MKPRDCALEGEVRDELLRHMPSRLEDGVAGCGGCGQTSPQGWVDCSDVVAFKISSALFIS